MGESLKRLWKELPAGFRVPVLIGAVILVGAFVAMIGPPVVSNILAPRAVSIKDLGLVTQGAKAALDLRLWNESEAPQSLTSLNLELTVENLPPSAGPGGLYVFGARGTMVVSTEGKGSISGNIRSLGTNQSGTSTAYPFSGSMIIMGDDRWVLALTLPLREQIGPGESLSLGVDLPETIKMSASGQMGQVQPWMKEYTSGEPPGEFRLLAFLQKSGKADAHLLMSYADRKVAGYRGSLKFNAKVGAR